MSCCGNKKYDFGVDSIFAMESTFFPLNSWSKYCKARAVYVLIPIALCACTGANITFLRQFSGQKQRPGQQPGQSASAAGITECCSTLQPLPENSRQRPGRHPGRTLVPRVHWARLVPPHTPATSLSSVNIRYFGN